MHVRRVEVGDVSLAVAEAGAGGRPLLLVHGFTGAKEDFTGFLDVLAERGWHAVAPDLRGHGASDHPPGLDAYDLSRFVGDVEGLADELGWDRFAVIGHSMGGAVAQRLALDHPERVQALVLMSTFHGPLDVDPGLVSLAVAIVHQGGMPALAAAVAARREADPGSLAAHRRIQQAFPDQAERIDGKLESCSPDMWLAMAPKFLAWPDTLDDVGRLTVPTLVVVGDEDDTMRAQCERLAQAIPGARLEVVAGTRHSPHLELPERWWPPVAAFLDSVASHGG